MKNPKLYLIVVTVALSVLVGIWMVLGDSSSKKSEQSNAEPHAFIADGDTNNEVLRTVAAGLKSNEFRTHALAASNKALSQKFNQKIAHLTSVMNDKLNAVQAQIHSQIQDEAASAGSTDHFGEDNYTVGGEGASEVTNNSDNAPIGNVTDIAHIKVQMKTKFKQALQSPATQSQKPNPLKPVYTIPANATAPGAALLNAVVAEVPVNGHLLAPAFPFRAIITKPRIFAANGMYLPENLSGIVVRGYSVGNMTLSCARAYVTQLTFVFPDGHYEVYPKKVSMNSTALFPENAIGYLSDVYGNPCIRGTYYSDAKQVLTNLALMSAGEGAGNAVAQTQFTTSTQGVDTARTFTGNVGTAALGGAFSGLGSGAYNWYKNRVNGIFDVVYIPTSSKNPRTHRITPTLLSLNFTQTIPINYNTQGRRIDERANQTTYMQHRVD